MMATPRARRSRARLKKWTISSGVRLAVGSSKIMMRASLYTARAISTIFSVNQVPALAGQGDAPGPAAFAYGSPVIHAAWNQARLAIAGFDPELVVLGQMRPNNRPTLVDQDLVGQKIDETQWALAASCLHSGEIVRGSIHHPILGEQVPVENIPVRFGGAVIDSARATLKRHDRRS